MDKDLCCARIFRLKTQHLEFKATTTLQWTIDLEIGSEFKTLLSFGTFLNLNPWPDFVSYVEMSFLMWKFAQWTPIWVLSSPLFAFYQSDFRLLVGVWGLIFTSFQENFLCIYAGVKQSLHTTTTKIIIIHVDKRHLENRSWFKGLQQG